MGDFNEFLSNDDKEGGPLRREQLMEEFRKTIDDCNVTPLDFMGDKFTWTNKNYNGLLVKERLDRGFTNGEWKDIFLENHINHLDYYSSDHRAIEFNVSLPNRDRAAARNRSSFSLFFTTVASNNTDFDALNIILEAINTSITEDMNDLLLKDFTSLDVDEALKSMAPDKSPGMDGMSAMFFQQHWDVVGPMVTASFLKILNEGADMKDINAALITLILKVDQPQQLSDFRPISLCSVLYNLVSKAIVGRFKIFLPVAISQNQSAFLPGRLITDNVLLAFELVHWLKNKKRGRQSYAALKLDMSKAFDRVEWHFLKAVMLKMGFHENWVELVMRCVSSSTLSFNINCVIKGLVTPQRGLRQGDPLSPYLFLICSEGLSALLRLEEQNGTFKGLSISRGAPSVSHLLFADDSLLFCHANESSCQAISRVLDVYHRASGQLLNTDKTVMSFSPNADAALKNRFHTVLGMPICDLHEKYLGLPSYAGRDKSELFSNIKDRIWKLMNSWHAKLFSIGGREVLLKVVVQSIPTYAMSCFSLPKKFCRQLESMMANFWWGSSTNKSKIHWKKMEFIMPKAEGGMGFRSFIHFNQALLAKQAWKILEDPHSLLTRVLKARYFKNWNFLNASKDSLPSLTWQSICDGRDLLIKGLRWKIGNGNSVKCASDPWLPGNTSFRPYTFCGDVDFSIEHYITHDRQWDLNLLRQHFGQIDIDRILSLSISPNSREDRLIWHHSDFGSYTVKSGYHLAVQLDKINESSTSDLNHGWWNRLWALKLPKKVKIFAWRVINDALPTQVNLMHRKISVVASCSLCNCPRESSGHALFFCTRAQQVWSLAHVFSPNPLISRMNGFEIFSSIATVKQNDVLAKILCLMWCIWTERNKEIHGSKPKPTGVICSFVDMYVQQFLLAHAKQVSMDSSCNNFDNAPATAPQGSHPQASSVWALPPTGSYKLNIDVAFNDEGSVIGIGDVVRDYFGDVVGALSKPLIGRCSVREMEATALLHSLQWALQLGLQMDYIETNSLIFANAINKHSQRGYVSNFYDLVADISLLLSSFPRVLVYHVKRDANKAAHELARFALRLDNNWSWLEEIPSPIHSVIVMDSIQ
uniref:Reverse transcriptase domain-containing protein n=1 Tax=Cannabis sativa TaxID=3483 RepID=A0A803QG02_CANSA